MCDLDENTAGQSEISPEIKAKLLEMSAAMDMFLSTTDSLSFPDVFDIDIKTEIDTLVGGHNDFSGLNFSDLPPLELEDVNDIKWFSHMSDHSNSGFSGEEAMVNPNAVMPIMTLSSIRSPSPSLKESHLTFSPSAIKIAAIKQEGSTVKKDLLQKLDDIEKEKKVIQPSLLKSVTTKVTPIIAKPTIKPMSKPPTILSFRNTVAKQLPLVVNNGTVRTVTAINRVKTTTNRMVFLGTDDDDRTFPKPAYSYSCLIAMALKNSRSGSLPVSEIYNFMCKHFPFFKTAPNGWKNSVRHNLSLNKCFEKIEKPALNGSQRKGCLWAMNPAKISKMDEEVQKWSRKDPHAIKKAMSNPENLGALERGEMKFSCSFDDDTFGDSCGSAEEGSDSEPEVQQRQFELVNVTAIKENGELSDMDIEVSDSMYEEDEESEVLQVEMSLHHQLAYEKTLNNKRRRTFVITSN